MKDLVVLVPDKNVKFGLESLLKRYDSLGTIPFSFDIFIHPERDPGIYKNAHDFLRIFSNKYRYSMVFIDYEGSGQESKNIDKLTAVIKNNLIRNGWQRRCEVIVFNPEAEIWLWVNSLHFYNYFGFNSFEELKNHLIEKGLWVSGQNKPRKPKEAFENLLKEKKIPRSSSIYGHFAGKVNFQHCQDTSFLKFKQTIINWFKP